MSDPTQYNGSVSVEDGTKAAEDYAPARKVNVIISFVAEGANAMDEAVNRAADKAKSKVDELLGRAIRVTSGEQGAAAENSSGPKPAPRTRAKPPAVVPQSPGAPSSPSADPSAVEDPSAVGDTGTTSTETKTSAGPDTPDPAAVDDWDVPAVVEVTDADINSAVQARNLELKDPVKIRNLIATFNPDPTAPFTLRQIPAAQRQDFLDKLAALA